MTSKYATLPDIDDQPEVFETPDGEETTLEFDQHDEIEDSNIERSSLTVVEAKESFDSNSKNSSEQLKQQKIAIYKRSLESESVEYESPAREESKQQRLRRLMTEVEELSNDIAASKDSSKEESESTSTDLLARIPFLQSELTRLQQRLADTNLNDSSSPNYGKRVEEAKSLIKQLEAFKNTKQQDDDQNDTVLIDKNDKGDVVTYELFYTPETAKMQKQSKAGEIDKRIAKLEHLVGSNAGQELGDMPTGVAATSLVTTIARLEQQITVLAQPRHLDTVTARVKVLTGELERLSDLRTGQKGSTGMGYGLVGASPTAAASGPNGATDAQKDGSGISADTEQKVNKLFATMERVDPWLSLTPALLTRLKGLKKLHTEAATFGSSVKVISGEQSRMAEELKNLSATCELLSKSVSGNEETINKNINAIDIRMTELVQRVGALTSATETAT